MSKNLIVDGNTYTGVQKIEALDSNTNEYVQFVDTSDANASSADILSGKTAYVDGQKITGSLAYVSSEDSGCLFIDYEGTELYQYTTAQALALTELPANPSHTGLTALGWNWTLQEIKDYLTDYPDAMVVVGQLYDTYDGASRFYISLTESQALTPTIYLNVSPNTHGYLDWGDGSQQVVIENSTASEILFSNTHEYNSTGYYVISIEISYGSIYFSGVTRVQTGVYRSGLFSRSTDSSDSNQIYLSSLKKIHLSDNCLPRGAAFACAYNLEEFTSPSTKAGNLSEHSFYYCTSLKSIVLSRGGNRSNLGTGVFEYSDIRYVSFSGDADISLTTGSASYAFAKCESLLYLTIPMSSYISTVGLGDYFASECYSLRAIVLPSDIPVLGSWSFSNCRSLKYVHLSPNITTLPAACFSGCYSLSNIIGLNNITRFENSCLANCPCDEVLNFSLSDSCTYIGTSVFMYNMAIKNLVIPNTVTSLGEIIYCPNIESVTINSSLQTVTPFSYCTSLKSVQIVNGATSLAPNAFYRCYSLTDVNIPTTVTSIGNYSFHECLSLTDVTIPDSVTSIGQYVFMRCRSLSKISIGSGVTSIGSASFLDCYALLGVYITSLVAWCNISFNDRDANPLCYAHNLYLNGTLVAELMIPDSVTSIGQYAFYNCHGLTSVTIGNSVTSIGYAAFYGCSAKSVVFPDSLTTVRDNAFRMSELQSVDVSSSVTSLGTQSFSECHDLQLVRFRGSSQYFPTSFQNIPNTCAFLVPFEYYSTFSQYTVSTYGNIGFATYPVGETLPTTDTSGTYNAVWYATLSDAKSETNPITIGNGQEVYARCTATS